MPITESVTPRRWAIFSIIIFHGTTLRWALFQRVTPGSQILGKGKFRDCFRTPVNKGLANPGTLSQNQRMKTRPPDLENINDNLPVEHQLTVIRRWAEQAGYQVVAATLQRAVDELETRAK